MEIKKEDIKHIANLSMLNLSDEEIEKYTKDMEQIVNFANKVNEIDTSSTEISAFSNDNVNVFRKDEIVQTVDKETLLQNAPSQEDGMFRIPKVIN